MIRKQSGLTMISWMVILGFIAIQGVMALRIIPVYMSYSSVKSIMNDLTSSSDVKGMSGKRLNMAFRKRLKINNMYDLAKDEDAFKFKKIEGGYTIVAHYEERGPIFGNLEFVATFDHQVDVKTK